MHITFVQKLIDKIRKKDKKKSVHNLKSVEKWFKVDGDNTLRLDYNLDSNSIVFDVGGFVGDFSAKIYEKYQPELYIFEPIKSFNEKIINKFQNNSKFHIFNFGLSDSTTEIEMDLSEDASSVYTKNDTEIEVVKLIDVKEFLEQHNIQSINLLKLNIEGGEYPLLERLIEIDWIKNIDNIQVQFHNLDENCENRMKKIQKMLSKTHELTYQYNWCWENWKKKEGK